MEFRHYLKSFTLLFKVIHISPMCNDKYLYFPIKTEKRDTSKNWEELGDISAIDVRLAALLCDRCGKSLSLSIR